MAKYSGVGAAPRILVLMLLVLALVIGGLVWFDYLGLVDVRQTLAPALRLVGVATPSKIPNAEDPFLLQQQRIDKRAQAIDLRSEQLDTRAKDIQTQEAQIAQKVAALDEQQKALAEQQKSFNDSVKQYENRNSNLQKVAQNLVSMPPDKAVAQIVNLSDQDIIDIFRLTDQISAAAGQNSIVPFWLSLMPADRAATISRKMLKQPGAIAQTSATGQASSAGP